MSDLVTIIGVDPGSTCTGWGVVAGAGGDVQYVASGAIRLPRGSARFEKLRIIHVEIGAVINRYHPTQFAIEEVFYNRNPRSTMTLGEARGAAILSAVLAGIPVFEYSAREVKQSVTGNGAAHKRQVGFMMGKILRLERIPQSEDETDALAIALCHSFKSRNWSVV